MRCGGGTFRSRGWWGGLIRHDVSNVSAELPPREQEVSLREGDQLIQQSEYTK